MYPTLREIEAVCQKPQWREVGSLLARRVARPAAVYLTWLAVRWPITANMVTAATLVVGVAAAVLLGLGRAPWFVAGAIVLNLWYLLDHVDGQVARFRRSESVTGVYFDFMMHHIVHPVVAFSLGYAIATQTEELHWTLAGGAFAFGVTMLSLANDCRYKAFYAAEVKGGGRRLPSPGDPGAAASEFQHAGSRGPERDHVAPDSLFSEETTASSHPTPEARTLAVRVLRIALHFGQKLCEMPNVIIAITILATVVAIRPRLGFQTVEGYVLVMSILAPMLALARLGKQVWFGQPDTDFQSLNATSRRAGGLTP